MMKPIINEVIEENPDVEYMPVDIDEHPETARDYGILGVPAFIMLDDENNITAQAVGAMRKQEFAARLFI
jgi:hypothetical protein